MTTTYHLNVNEISMKLLDSIKAAFKDSTTVDITVSESMDETEYLLSSKANREHLERSMKQAEEGDVVVFTLEELQNKYGK